MADVCSESYYWVASLGSQSERAQNLILCPIIGASSLGDLTRVFELAELHADLFSRHASPLELCVFVAVDERGEDVMPDEIKLFVVDATENSKQGGVAAEALGF